MTDWQAILATATEAARAAGALALAYRQRAVAVEMKGYRDIVTEADREAQQLITARIRERFPYHGVIGEEEEDGAASAENTPTPSTAWIIDPIDGTSNYAAGVPVYAISIGVLHEGKPQVGVVYDPVHDELFSAVAGRGARLNGEELLTGTAATPGAAIFALDWSRTRVERQRALDTLNRVAHDFRTIRALGSATLAIAWVAAGRIDVYYNYNLKLWDIAASALILREAGGQTSSTAGRPLDCADSTTWHLSSNGRVHEAVIGLLDVG